VNLPGQYEKSQETEEVKMKPRTEKSLQLYDVMLKRGYPQEFCEQVTLNLNTDWTANRMLGYLSHYKKLPMEEVADEMLSILSDRNRIMQKKELESTNARWNEYLNERREENRGR
jgi:hypothetical protein